MTDLIERATLNKRKKQRDEHRTEDMRTKLSFVKTMIQIDDIEDDLIEMANTESEISSGKVGAFKAVLDSKWKKINKLLPDLARVESKITIQKHSDDDYSEEELLAIIDNES